MRGRFPTAWGNALARFERDVLSQPGADAVIVLLGINDISWPGTAFDPDAVIDFDKHLRDPDEPARLRPVFDSGDHLHPGSLGNKAMADYVELDLLRGGSNPHH